MNPANEKRFRASDKLPPAGEPALDEALDRFSAAIVEDRELAIAEFLAAFPDRRAEMESLLSAFEFDDVDSASDALPPLPSQVELDSVAASNDETDREPIWSKLPSPGTPTQGSVLEAEVRTGDVPGTLPRQLGSYELLELIDSGGMGVVYKARSLASVQRLVAVKVIKPEIGGREILSRFSLECQSLALMNHPSIATVYEGGVTELGEPFLAMELVDGVSLTQYCSQHAVDVRSRLALFRKVCAGIEHAHQKGVIHRDVKPSNVLVSTVDGSPIPKVIDFGLAKIASSPSESDATLYSSHTQLGQILGTLQYMSPEGATLRPSAIDTRSDVFSLGVVLFELLAGSTPLADQLSSDLPIDERLRRVRSQEPARPSDRATGAEQRQLRGDLDAICLKALALDPAERYPTTAALSTDIENYLLGRPVSAAAASGAYKLRKFVRRYGMPLVVAGSVATLLLIATGISVRWAIRATNAEQELTTQLQVAVDAQQAESAALQRAESERETAQAISDFLRLDLLAQASPLTGAGHDLTIREVVDQAAGSLGDRFDDQPRIKGELLATIAGVYYDLSEYAIAQPYWIEAHQLLSKHGDDDGYRAMVVNHAAAENCLRLGLSGEAEMRLQQNLRYLLERGSKWPDKLRLTRAALSLVMKRLGKESEADALQAALLIETEAAGESTLALRNNWAMDLVAQRRYGEALPIMQQVFDEELQRSGGDDVDTMMFQSNLACCLARCDKYDEALAHLDDLAERRARVLGPSHMSVLVDRQYRADCLLRQGRAEESVAEMKSLIADCQRMNLDLSSRMIANDAQLADGLFDLDQGDAAVDVLRSFVKRYLNEYGSESEVATQALARATNSLNNHRKYEVSRELLDEHWGFQDGNFDDSIALTDLVLVDRWLKAVRGMKDYKTLNDATAKLLRVMPSDSDSWKAERAKVQYMAGFAQQATEQQEAAVQSFRDAYATQLAILGDAHPETLDSQLNLGLGLLKVENQVDAAEEVLWPLIQTVAKSYDLNGNRGIQALEALNEVADHYRAQGELTMAETLAEQLVAFCVQKLGPEHRETLSNYNGLGLTLRAYKTNEKYSQAESVFQRAIEQAGTPTKENRTAMLPLLYNRALTLKSLQRGGEAADCYLKCAGETRIRYGPEYYRAEKADVAAAECLIELDDKGAAAEILQPLCAIDADTPVKNIPIRLTAIDLLLDCQDESNLEATADRIRSIFESSSEIRQLDVWDRSKLAMAAAGTLRRVSDKPEKLAIALELNRAAVDLRSAADPTNYRTSSAYRGLGHALEAVGDESAAEAAFLKAYEILTLKPPATSARKRSVNTAVEALVEFYSDHGKTGLSAEWAAKKITVE